MEHQTVVAKTKNGDEFVACSGLGSELCSIHSCESCPKMKSIRDSVSKLGYTGNGNDFAELLNYLFNKECEQFGNYAVMEVCMSD